MGVVLDFLKHLNIHFTGIPTHIITGKVYEHNVLGIFLFIGC